MKRLFFLVITLLSIASVCLASNPLLHSDREPVLPPDKNCWKMIYLNPNDFVIFVDSENYQPTHELLHDNCRMADTWEWRAYFNNDSSDLFKDTYTISNVIYDFNCKTISIQRIIEYDKTGKMLGDFSYSYSPKRIIPESTGELIFKGMDYYDKHKTN